MMGQIVEHGRESPMAFCFCRLDISHLGRKIHSINQIAV